MTRYRRKLVQAISAEKNRIQKVLEDANIKLSSVVSDTFGVSSTIIIDELIKGELTKGELTIEEMAGLVKGRLTRRKAEIKEALVGKFQEHHKFMISSSLNHIKSIEKSIADIGLQIDKKLAPY